MLLDCLSQSVSVATSFMMHFKSDLHALHHIICFNSFIFLNNHCFIEEHIKLNIKNQFSM